MRTRRLGIVLAGTAVVLLGSVATSTTSLATDQPPPGAITKLAATFPNYWYDHRNDPFAAAQPIWDTVSVSDVVDPTRGRVFSFDPYACPWLVSQDMTTGATLRTNRDSDGSCPTPAGITSHSKSLPGFVDTTDGVIGYLSGVYDGKRFGQPAVNNRTGYLFLASEDTLMPFAEIALPPLPYSKFMAISWYQPSDQLILAASNTDLEGQLPVGVQLFGYDMRTLIAGDTRYEWTSLVPQCNSLLATYFARADVQRSADGTSLYVPCELSGGNPFDGNVTPAKDGVVRLHLGGKDQLGRPCGPDPCPDGGFTTAQAPGVGTDFIFDPGADRGFFVDQSGSSTDLTVYDGRSGRFIGRSNVGGTEDANNVAFGLDTTTGRIFAAGGGGLTVIEGRSTPVSPGDLYREYGGTYQYVNLPVLPPDALHPYRRLLLPNDVPAADNGFRGLDFLVVADTLSDDKAAGPLSIDANTHTGAIAPGSQTSIDYGGNAAGYGVHARWVGGPGALVGNVSIGRATSPLSADADLLAGQVQHLRIRRGSADGSAGALGDGNGSTSSAYQACSSGPTASGCVDGGPGAPVGVAPAQPWAFPDAQCSQPGPADDATGESVGATAAPSGADPAPLPPSGSEAEARVDCSLDRSPTASSTLGAFGLTGVPGPAAVAFDLGVGQSHVEGGVAPPPLGGRTMSTVTATARGVHLGLGSLGAFDIGAVTQTAVATAGGTTGTATGTDTVTLEDVTLERDGKVQTLCSGACPDPQAVLDTLNSVFAGEVELSLPALDPRYASGSPGGYIAAIEADLAEQYGDEQFNGMSPEEAALHPGLRMVVYGYSDGLPAMSRAIVDLAGVEADAELGVQVLAPFDSGARGAGGVDEQAAAEAAGVPMSAAILGGVAPPSAAVVRALGPAPMLGGGLVGLIQRSLAGFSWLWQSPWGALQLLLAFGLLGVPVALARRRRAWMDSVLGGRR
jgi:hypothetical protein